MPAHFSVFLQQVQRYCEKSLISRKVLPLWLYGPQPSSAVPHAVFEVEDAAAGVVGLSSPPSLANKMVPAKSTVGAGYPFLHGGEAHSML